MCNRLCINPVMFYNKRTILRRFGFPINLVSELNNFQNYLYLNLKNLS